MAGWSPGPWHLSEAQRSSCMGTVGRCGRRWLPCPCDPFSPCSVSGPEYLCEGTCLPPPEHFSGLPCPPPGLHHPFPGKAMRSDLGGRSLSRSSFLAELVCLCHRSKAQPPGGGGAHLPPLSPFSLFLRLFCPGMCLFLIHPTHLYWPIPGQGHKGH